MNCQVPQGYSNELEMQQESTLTCPVVLSVLLQLEAVIELSNTLENFEANPLVDAVLAYSRACSILQQINLLARSLEISEMPPDQIRQAFVRIRSIMATSPLGHHMQAWPRGYQGDFAVIEYIATGVNRAVPGTFAFDLETAMLHSGMVQQHRYKLRCQSEAFLRALTKHHNSPRMLSIGCGGCRDLLPLLPLLESFSGELVLNDIDPAALAFAGKRLLPVTTRFRCLCTNALSAIRTLRNDRPFDLVVAGGLFDYIQDRLLAVVLRTIFHQLLAPGGVFLFTNIAEGNLYRPLMRFAVDWELIERSEAQLRDLCLASSIPEECLTIEREESSLTWIAHIHKPTHFSLQRSTDS